ncbi:polymer biosynthesis protein, WecB/TagA/CpsF family [Roseicitreum antarcticum]|uniref:Polymer biosynthesis protein, WecB/TagA/CpsF family n=2 Tax=Roseicitreum antarcticum TaxID=564137 RepID=A0A1H2RYK0_9RHOB|nr:polymer biosynthesis protein, WecB/TagA/CpsF family [Roseicitreum antarcticum]
MQRFRAGEGFALATINLDHVVKLTNDPEFREVYAAQDLVVADGNPIVWLSKIAGLPVDLLPGSDMLIPLAKLAARAGTPIALVGSTDKVLNAAGEQLQKIIPDLQIATKISPPFNFDPRGPDAMLIFEQIRQSGAGMVFVALGAPKQETFAAMGRMVLPGVGFASIGAALDFISGYFVRAPLWVRKLTLEWLWRVLNEPQRLIGRYTRCILVLPRQVVAALLLRWSGASRATLPSVSHVTVPARASEASAGCRQGEG